MLCKIWQVSLTIRTLDLPHASVNFSAIAAVGYAIFWSLKIANFL